MAQFPEVIPPYRPMQLYDIRDYEVGDVYYIDDELIVIPSIDRTMPGRNSRGKVAEMLALQEDMLLGTLTKLD